MRLLCFIKACNARCTLLHARTHILWFGQYLQIIWQIITKHESGSCVLTRRGFAMYIKLIAKPLAFALFTVSGSLLDRRVAFRSAREAAFGPSRRPTAGFRRLRWRAHLHQKRRNYPMDPYRRQPTPIVTAFPR